MLYWVHKDSELRAPTKRQQDLLLTCPACLELTFLPRLTGSPRYQQNMQNMQGALAALRCLLGGVQRKGSSPEVRLDPFTNFPLFENICSAS